MSTPSLRERIGAINDVVCAASLLNWDTRTMMPAGGALVRGRQIATLINVARDLLCADATLRALEEAEAQQQQGCDPRTQAEIIAVRRALTLHTRVPAEVVGRRAALKPLAAAAWAQARACRDFSLFAAHLGEAITAVRDFAAAAGGEHPCDAMIDLHEPGETFASQQVMLASVRQGLEPILSAVQGRRPSAPQPLPGPFPLAAQRQVAIGFAERFGFDFGRGRLDSTQHPFESAFTRDDVRITTRFRDDDPATALFGTFHEVGHGLYEQNIDPSFTGSALGTDLATLYPMGGAGSGVHESQSRLFENHVGRSRSFWLHHFGELRQAFPGAFDGLDAEAFYRRITWAGPSRIRTEADEVTYDFHVFLRFELEAALMTGQLSVADLPAAWNEGMRAALGIEVRDDAEGCLQDIHWAVGEFGSFASYTVGNVMAAQLMETIRARDPRAAAGLGCGDYRPLGDWLRRNIWRHGRLYTRDQLLTRATGCPLDVAPYLRYLGNKYVADTSAPG